VRRPVAKNHHLHVGMRGSSPTAAIGFPRRRKLALLAADC
jgi:hypothetical protein